MSHINMIKRLLILPVTDSKCLIFLLMAVSILSLASCDNNVAFDEYRSLDAVNGWHMNDMLVFEKEFSDTTQLYDLFLNVRNTTDYRHSNFFIFFQTNFPDGRVFRDTLEMTLADNTGKWKGKGFGRIRTNSFHFRKDVWFPVQGTYRFSIQQAMREEKITGISDIGLRVEKK